MRLSSGYEVRKARFEIVPLMDVIFLLLSSFIYATLKLSSYDGIDVKLPRGAGAAEKAEMIVISVAADNSLWFDGRQVGRSEAVSMAVSGLAGKNDPVVVNGDVKSDLGVAVELLSELRNAGVKTVSFRVEKKQ